MLNSELYHELKISQADKFNSSWNLHLYRIIITVKARPSEEEIIQLRGLMLTFIDRIITSSGEILEDELQCFLNFVTTVNEVRPYSQ